MRIALFNLSISGFQELLLEKKYRDYEVNNNNGKLYFGSFSFGVTTHMVFN